MFWEYGIRNWPPSQVGPGAEPVLEGTITGVRVPMPFDLNTNHFVAGVSLRF
jgi:hypothetical protein